MPYDPNIDKTLASDDIGDDFQVSIKQYGNGEQKITILKKFETADGQIRYTSKIGRLSKDQAVEIAETILKLSEEI